MTQLLLIFSFFIAISRGLGGTEPLGPKVVSSFGTLLVCFGLMLNIASFTFVLEAGYQSIKSLTSSLQHQLLNNSGSEKKVIKNVIKEIEDLKPLTGNGYFSISRGVLTSKVSVGITYIIILVQFKISAS